MAKIDYDAFEGLGRMSGVLEGLHPQAAAVLACHIALEREVTFVLARSVVRPEYLSKLNYAQKVDVLAAVWAGDNEDAKTVHAALLAFGTLRNKIVHGNDEKIASAYADLQGCYAKIRGEEKIDRSIEDIAGGIIAFFGDAPPPEFIRGIAEGLGDLLRQLSQAFGEAVTVHK